LNPWNSISPKNMAKMATPAGITVGAFEYYSDKPTYWQELNAWYRQKTAQNAYNAGLEIDDGVDTAEGKNLATTMRFALRSNLATPPVLYIQNVLISLLDQFKLAFDSDLETPILKAIKLILETAFLNEFGIAFLQALGEAGIEITINRADTIESVDLSK
jgi:hypothetical protein